MKMAYWIKRTHLFSKDEYKCSYCGNHADKPYKTCPSCGIRMKGIRNDPFDADEMEMADEIFDE